MLLRRITKHVKDQNWFAVGIDFAIVVFGVFIGTQVGNWNAQRLTDDRAVIFTERLLSDLREEAWAYEHLVEYNRDVLVNAERTVDALSGRTSLNPETFLIAAYRATQYKFLERRRATYDELLSTGEINIIRDTNIRQTAVMVFTDTVPDLVMDEGHDSEFRRLFRQHVPAPVQRELLQKCGDLAIQVGDYEGIQDSLEYSCALDLEPALLVEAAQALQSAPNILLEARVRFADVETAITDLVINNSDIRTRILDIAGRPTP